MARPVWTPIVAPDLADAAIRAQQASGLALDRAFSGVGSALDRFEAQRREANLAELYARENAFAATNDVGGFLRAQGDGSLIKGLPYLRSGDIAGTRSFGNELRTTRNADTAYTRGEQAFAREEADRASALAITRGGEAIRADLAAGRIDQAEADRRAQALALQTQNAGQVSAAFGFSRAGVADSRANTNWEREGIRFADSRQDRQWMIEDRTDARQAAAVVQKYRDLGGDFSNLRASDDYIKATPQQKILMTQMFGGTVDTTGSGAFAGPDADPSRVMNYTARNVGIGAVPDYVKTLGDASEFAKEVNRKGASSSAMGLYQITGDTLREFGPKVYRSAWANQQFTPEVQDKIAEAIFNSAKGSADALSKRWVSLSPAKAEAVRKMPWEQARAIIAEGESGARLNQPSAEQNRALVSRVAVNAATQIGTDRNGWMVNLPTAFADDSSLAAVADRITSKGGKGAPAGPLAGQDSETVQKELRRVQDEYSKIHTGKTLKAAAAAVILEQAARPYGGMDWFHPFSRRTLGGRGTLNSFKGNQFVVDDQLLQETLSQIKFDTQGNVQGLNDIVARRFASQQDIAQSRAAFTQLEALRAALTKQEADDRQFRNFNNPVTEDLRRKLDLAQSQLNTVVAIADERAGARTR